jgi:hypothetical protein
VLQYAGTQKTIPEIARELNVESVMEGSVRYADGRVLVTAQLVDAATNLHLWSESYEREFSNIFAIQSDIAMNVANALEAEFSPAEQASIERPPTDSLEAYELYLAAQDEYRSPTTVPKALESIDAALALDSEFARAWALKSQILDLLSQGAAGDSAPPQREAMFAAARKAAELDPTLLEAQAQLGLAYTGRAEWTAAERILDGAYTPSSGPAAFSYGLHLWSVGRLGRAREAMASFRRLDPLSQPARSFFLLGLALSGDADAAQSEYDRGKQLFGHPWMGDWFVALGRLSVGESVTEEEIPATDANSLQNEMREYLGAPESALAALRERYGDGGDVSTFVLVQIGVWSAYFGDSELALRALEEATARNAQNALHFWLPSMREVRQTPRFKEFIREVGLVDYWREFGWSDLCRPVGATDFECD